MVYIGCAAPNSGGPMYCRYKRYLVRDQLIIPSKIGRHMREKGAVVGPDTFLAQTLNFAVRLSGTTDRWEVGRRETQSGLQEVHTEVLCGACSSRYLLQYAHVAGQAQANKERAKSRAVWLGCINHSDRFTNSVAALHTHKAYSGQQRHKHMPLSLTRTRNPPTATTACQDIGCKHLGTFPHIAGAGDGSFHYGYVPQ